MGVATNSLWLSRAYTATAQLSNSTRASVHGRFPTLNRLPADGGPMVR